MEYGYGQAYWLTKANGMLVKKDGTREMITKSEIIQRDGVGNILKKSVNTGEITYTYDNLYQLTGYENEAAGDIAYGYDYRGNRESMDADGATTTYDLSNNNKTTSINSTMVKTLTYDTRGNLQSKGGYGNTWDYKNRLVAVGTGGGDVTYKYNNADRKIYREFGPYYTRKGVFYYYNGDKLICEKDGTGKLTKVYTNDNTGVLGMSRYIYDENGSFKSIQKLYYLFDDLGSVTAITAETGLPVKYYLYDPFGNVTNTKQDEFNMFTFIGRYGGQKDWDTGFTQFQHRWYDSEIGKWLSRDPIGIKGGVNLYGYVGNNGVNKIDPSGLRDCVSGFTECVKNVTISAIKQYAIDLKDELLGEKIGTNGVCAIAAAFGCTIFVEAIPAYVVCVGTAFKTCSGTFDIMDYASWGIDVWGCYNSHLRYCKNK